jgi:hypothetical protein
MCRMNDAFFETLLMLELGFERAQAAETGRPSYNPRDLLKVYLYGYLNQIRCCPLPTAPDGPVRSSPSTIAHVNVGIT